MNSPNSPSWLIERAQGCVLLVAAQPGAKRSELVGVHDGQLRVRIHAPPLEGRANDALCAWLAQQLGCARRQVRVLRGDSSRRKQLEVELPAGQVRAVVESLLAQGGENALSPVPAPKQAKSRAP